MVSTALVSTAKPVPYMRQLCKHFAHRVSATYDDASGKITFGFGECDLLANDTHLALRVTARSLEDLSRLEWTVARHLERFGRRDELAVTWQRGLD